MSSEPNMARRIGPDFYLSVTTRGIGFATAIFYDKAITDCPLQNLSKIATIHQVYRVGLWLTHYKVFLAMQIQSKLLSSQFLQGFSISKEQERILREIFIVPSTFYVVLDAIGNIETETHYFHSGYAKEPTNPAELLKYRTLVVTPDNIRNTLERLSNPEIPAADVTAYLNYNSIPGLRVEDGKLLNIDDVYPADYSLQDLINDVHSYENFLSSFISFVGRGSIMNMPRSGWSGNASSAGLWSSALVKNRISSIFRNLDNDDDDKEDSPCRVGPGRIKEATSSNVLTYFTSTVQGESTTFWSREETPPYNVDSGIASMVGEECVGHTRAPALVGRVYYAFGGSVQNMMSLY